MGDANASGLAMLTCYRENGEGDGNGMDCIVMMQ